MTKRRVKENNGEDKGYEEDIKETHREPCSVVAAAKLGSAFHWKSMTMSEINRAEYSSENDVKTISI